MFRKIFTDASVAAVAQRKLIEKTLLVSFCVTPEFTVTQMG